MNCRKTREMLGAHAHGDASTSQRAAVEAHLAQCAACAREAALAGELARSLRSDAPRQVSDRFEHDLFAALEARRPAASGAAWWERLRLRLEWRVRVPAMMTAGSLAIACVAGLCTLRVQDQLLAQHQERVTREQRREFVSTAVERYEQLRRADPNVDWDAVDASIQLSSGVLTE